MPARTASLTGVALFVAAFAAADVIHLRDGSRIEGKVRSCDEEACSIDRRRIERTEIVRITLGAGAAVPPGTPRAVVLTDGTIRPGLMTDVNLGYVSIGEIEIDRGDVAEIIIVPAQPAAQDSPSPPVVRDTPAPEPQPQPQQPPPPPPAAPPPPSQPPPASPPPRPRYGQPDEPIRRGRLWTGQIIGRMWTRTADESSSLDISMNVRLREYTRTILSDPPNVKKVAEFIFLNDEGTVVKNAYRSQSGSDTCSGSGESNPFTHPPGSWSSTIYRRIAQGAMPAMAQFDIPAGPGFYVLASIPAAGGLQTYRRTCNDGFRTTSYDMPYEVATAGSMPYPSVLIDPQMRRIENGRMSGSYTVSTPDRHYQFAAASWSVCLEGMDCPPPAPLDPESTDTAETPPEDPCARSGQQAALADTCRLQLDAMVSALEPLFAEYNGLMAAVNEDADDFEAMQKYCLAYDIAQQILESIISGGTGPAAEAAQALLHLRELIGKVQSGSIVAEFYPSEVKKVLDIYKKTKAVWFELTADDVTRMQRDLGDCSGKAPTETYMAAKRFVDNLAASRRVWDTRVAPAINDVRSKGQECASRNHAAWRACLEDAQCREETPNCGPEPSLDSSYE